jgi:uncharacterized protein (DUF1919 family)
MLTLVGASASQCSGSLCAHSLEAAFVPPYMNVFKKLATFVKVASLGGDKLLVL